MRRLKCRIETGHLVYNTENENVWLSQCLRCLKYPVECSSPVIISTQRKRFRKSTWEPSTFLSILSGNRTHVLSSFTVSSLNTLKIRAQIFDSFFKIVNQQIIMEGIYLTVFAIRQVKGRKVNTENKIIFKMVKLDLR